MTARPRARVAGHAAAERPAAHAKASPSPVALPARTPSPSGTCCTCTRTAPTGAASAKSRRACGGAAAAAGWAVERRARGDAPPISSKLAHAAAPAPIAVRLLARVELARPQRAPRRPRGSPGASRSSTERTRRGCRCRSRRSRRSRCSRCRRRSRAGARCRAATRSALPAAERRRRHSSPWPNRSRSARRGARQRPRGWPRWRRPTTCHSTRRTVRQRSGCDTPAGCPTPAARPWCPLLVLKKPLDGATRPSERPLTSSGPSSPNIPIIEDAPGPPFIQTTSGAVGEGWCQSGGTPRASS